MQATAPPARACHVVFSHGKESGPWGAKILAMSAVAKAGGFTVDSIDYQGLDDPAARVAKLVGAIGQAAVPLLLVGSSLGGHVCTAAAVDCASEGALGVALPSPVRGIFLLAPAFFMPGYEALTPPVPPCPVEIVHGWHDEIVPVDHTLRWARPAAVTVHLLDTDHRMHAAIDPINVLFAAFLKRFG